MTHLITPQTEAEFEQYYQFRWRLLRAPLNLPPGSERDEYDTVAIHRMLVDQQGNTVAVARMHQISTEEAQLRYIAVDDQYQKQGLGSQLVAVLEQVARNMGISRILINARLNALDFYQKCGFHAVGEGPTHFGKIKHQQLRKDLTRASCGSYCNEWGASLSQIWQSQLPGASHLAPEVESYDGTTLVTTVPLAANIGSDGYLFSGAIFGLCNLTGWGAIHLALKAHNLDAVIRLSHADLEMLNQIADRPLATASGETVVEIITPLRQGESVAFTLKVELYSQSRLAARFVGHYRVEPQAGVKV